MNKSDSWAEPCEFCENPEDIILALKPKSKSGSYVREITMVEPNLCPMCGRGLKCTIEESENG